MSDLVTGKIYVCRDGNVRRLRTVTGSLIKYEIPVGEAWVPGSTMTRAEMEPEFTEGEIVESIEEAIDKIHQNL